MFVEYEYIDESERVKGKLPRLFLLDTTCIPDMPEARIEALSKKGSIGILIDMNKDLQTITDDRLFQKIKSIQEKFITFTLVVVNEKDIDNTLYPCAELETILNNSVSFIIYVLHRKDIDVIAAPLYYLFSLDCFKKRSSYVYFDCGQESKVFDVGVFKSFTGSVIEYYYLGSDTVYKSALPDYKKKFELSAGGVMAEDDLRALYRTPTFVHIIFFPSFKCNLHCRHCFVNSSLYNTQYIGKEPLKKVIDDVLEIPEYMFDTYSLPTVIIAGGEPTLFLEDVLEVTDYASQRGFPVRLDTNGLFFQDDPSIMKTLYDKGVTLVSLSITGYHLEGMEKKLSSTGAAYALYEEILKEGIKNKLSMMVRLIISSSYTMETLFDEFLHPALQRGITGDFLVSGSIVNQIGRGEKLPEEDLAYRKENMLGACYNALSLSVYPNGDIYPCYRPFPHLNLGNIFSENLKSILERMRSNKFLELLFMIGPYQLCKELDLSVPEDVHDKCELCKKLGEGDLDGPKIDF